MLAPSRNHRAEAKYNVTTEFPYLGLHTASASGDIGLVQYALSHGQPVNSVLDGVLPLHVACAGGNDLVVNLLIDHGADVNAIRLPRRYSDRNRDVTAPIVGTSGSTPLHFAAANGHSSVVRTLLAHGAVPHRADKHGITPEHIARENGWVECAELLASSVASMREIERAARSDRFLDSDNASRERMSMDHQENSLRKRLIFKRSVDHALNALKSSNGTTDTELRPVFIHSNSSEQDQHGEPSPHAAPPTLPGASGCRPSLPHVDGEPTPLPPFTSRSRRPRSAGTGAEIAPARKLHSKLSLLSLFRKPNADGSSSSVASEHNPRSPPPSSPIPFAPSPASGSVCLPVSPRNNPVSLSSSPRDTSYADYQQRKLESTTSPLSVRAHLPQSSDGQNNLTSNCSRHRSASGASETSGINEEPSSHNPPVSSTGLARPGILRMHNRSSSGHSGQGLFVSSPRIIRFQRSTSSISSLGRSRNAVARGPQSLRPLNLATGIQREDDLIPDTIEESPVVPAQSPPPIFVNIAADDDEQEEEYGVPLDDTEFPSNSLRSSDPLLSETQLPFSIKLPPPSVDLAPPASENRLRGDSVSSTSTAGTTETTSTYPLSSSSEAAWSVGTPSTPHLSPRLILASAVIEVDSELNGVGREAHEAPRQSPMLLDTDLSTISSPAQAEELVQQTQQSIMNMEPCLAEHTKRDAETGRTLLSARLAAYGESLAIERRLKEELRVKSDPGVHDEGSHVPRGRSLLTTTKPSTMRNDGLSKSASAGVSLGVVEATLVETSSDHARRPGPGRSASYDLRDATRFISGGDERLLYTPPRPQVFTPDLDIDPLGEADSPFSCAPSTPTRLRGREGGDPLRSAQKLSRMGMGMGIDSWHHPSAALQLPHKGDAVHGRARSPPPRHFFGSIRTLMQSLQGK